MDNTNTNVNDFLSYVHYMNINMDDALIMAKNIYSFELGKYMLSDSDNTSRINAGYSVLILGM